MLSGPYQSPVPAVSVLGVGQRRGKGCLLLSEGAIASFQLFHLSLRHRGIPVSLPHNSSLICDCSIPQEPPPRVGYSHSCIGWRAEKPTDTDVNIETQIQKQTGTSSSKPEPRGMCIWGGKMGSMEGQAEVKDQ